MSDPSRSPPDASALTSRYGEHLFINGDSNDVNGQHSGTVTIKEADQAAWLAIVQSRAAQAAGFGAAYQFLLAPDKQSVYRHLLPDTFCCRPAAFLTASPDVVDVAAELRSVAPLIDVYSRTDSHWNDLGAWLAVQLLQARLGRDVTDIVSGWEEPSRFGDLGGKFSPMQSSTVLSAKLADHAVMIYDNWVPNNGRIRIWSKPVDKITGEPTRLLIFGDSFSYQLVHFLRELYDVVLHVHSFAHDARLFPIFAPHVVLSEITERFVLRLPNPGDGEALDKLWQHKVKLKENLDAARIVPAAELAKYPAQAREALSFVEGLLQPFRELGNSQ